MTTNNSLEAGDGLEQSAKQERGELIKEIQNQLIEIIGGPLQQGQSIEKIEMPSSPRLEIEKIHDLDEFLTLLEPWMNGKRVLDLFCGHQPVKKYFQEKDADVQITGVDIFAEEADIKGDVAEIDKLIKPEGQFDCVSDFGGIPEKIDFEKIEKYLGNDGIFINGYSDWWFSNRIVPVLTSPRQARLEIPNDDTVKQLEHFRPVAAVRVEGSILKKGKLEKDKSVYLIWKKIDRTIESSEQQEQLRTKMKSDSDFEKKKKQSEAQDQKKIQKLRDEHGFEEPNQNEDIKRKEITEKVENYPHLDLQEKVELLLVLGGYKKANEQDFESEEWYDGQAQKNVDEEKINSYEKLLEEIGLVYEKKRDIAKGRRAYEEDNYEYVRNIERVRYTLAKNKEDIAKYKKAEQEESDELYGEIYGFPKTSIESFRKPGGIIEYNELPDEIKKDEDYAFLTFKLSRDNFQEEFKTAKKWAEFVRRNSPKIYQEYLKYMKKVEGR